ncbi:MAG: GNAT family N-acetyltransferase [Jatrophihabitantaceae bacterium]
MLSEQLLGSRIVLRYRRAERDGRPPLTDLVGELVELTDQAVTVRSRAGEQVVPRSAVLLVRRVGASRRDILELARISRLGWRAAHQFELSGWLLSADRGWTGRANSVLPLRTPEQPLTELLTAARAFYAGHGLPLWVQLPLPARGLLDAELAGRCWQRHRPAVVLTRPLTGLEPAAGLPVQLAAAPDDDWLDACRQHGAPLPDFARQLLIRHDTVTFASIRLAGRTVAVGRGCVDEGWLGITSIEVAPDCRRQGLASALVGQLAAWGAGHGATTGYLQVDEANEPALALHARLGFTFHHRYHYRVEPAEPGAC